ncbi:hypothetical protein TNCV_2402921, partial [Trichonephila clavipes]
MLSYEKVSEFSVWENPTPRRPTREVKCENEKLDGSGASE